MNATAHFQVVERPAYFDFDKNNIDNNLIDLILKVANKDCEAFTRLYKLSSPKLFRIVLSILRPHQLASDALQETYVKIWLNASKYDPALGSPWNWMAVIARHQALDTIRRAQPLWLADELVDEHPSTEMGALETCIHNENLKALLLCLAKLDARKRELLMYAYYRGASRKELSVRFGIPVPSIKTLLRRFLAELKDLLSHS